MKKILSTLLVVATLAVAVFCIPCHATEPEETQTTEAIALEEAQDIKTEENQKEIDKSKIRKKVDYFIAKNRGYLPDDKIPQIRIMLNSLSLEELDAVSGINFNNPMFIQLISFLFGETGVDRLLIGDSGMFILKWFTLGGLGILWLYDLCTIKGKVREKNYEKLMSIISEIC